MQQDTKSILTTGRRKESRARVRLLLDGQGKVTINGKDITKYFVTVDQVMQVKKPFTVSSTEGKFDVLATVTGGGINGQAGAISLGISRALLGWNPELRPTLRKENLLTRDPRTKERKKYGRKGARRRFQWTKR
ncbi:MAG: 30S ribosomal protein S9 [Candidatus Omnitrophica bacterium]|jgi:small subunit ribosomal protein S9|nr:30S ribosomal protein S9 [Candidatus Omnitrophota bacterium]